MSTTPADVAVATQPKKESTGARLLRIALTERVAALAVLTVILVIVFYLLGNNGNLYAPFDLSYMVSSLQAFVPVALLALAEMFVITSGRSGIDLSVGAMVSLCGLVFGALVQHAGMPVLLAALVAIIVGGLMGLLNGVLVGYFGFPPLIATLATSYAFASIAMVASGQAPISGSKIAATHELTRNLPLFGDVELPIQVLTFLLPAMVISWFMLEHTTWGRSLLAIGTNDTAAAYAGQSVRWTRASAYMASGLLSGVAAVVNVAQFASARPDAGTSGNGMALPAITIAALGGVLISGGLARVSGVMTSALLITWLNAALLISFQGSLGPRTQLLALGLLLICSVLLNSYAARRYGLRA
ncbi:ABC transporter permease [Cutibacterium equinum]|uniref:ABC transporter permease n=1 Tax=Cutibacterium equinum TaxID=3016342 RepID=A0ABY7QZL6_9ACTN|nr:ABC transporter permease [Cutibacterium equinum]WCC80431.1 ABC transporter permease [Cutibacterium equinum]